MSRAWGRVVAAAMLTTSVALLSACDGEFEYSDYHCNLVIENSVHQDATLATAMNSMSPGVFCTIKYSVTGTHHYIFTNNQGLTSTKNFNAKDLERVNNLRIGMENGIVVGFGNLSSPAVFYAYDLECPNCYDPNALPVVKYELSIGSDGIATCSSCKRTYNLNTGGNVVKTETKASPMTRYRASTSGAFGILYVN